MKKELVTLLALFLSTPLILLTAHATHPDFTVGIVLVDDSDDYYARLIIAGYREYGDYFEAELLPYRFNASAAGVRLQPAPGLEEGFYLNSDFIRLARPLEIARQFGVDIILLLTDHPMSNWDGDNSSIWGEAHPEASAVLMSSAFLNPNLSADDMGARQTAMHETLHLLGYSHTLAYQHGIMGYGDYSAGARDLLPYERFQLPLRAHVLALLGPSSYNALLALTRLAFTLALLPAFAATELLVYRRYSPSRNRRYRQPPSQRQPQRQPQATRRQEPAPEAQAQAQAQAGAPAPHHKTLVVANLLVSFWALTLLVESFGVLAVPVAAMVGSHWLYARRVAKAEGG